MLQLWKRVGDAAPSTRLNLLVGARQVVVRRKWVLRESPAHASRVGSRPDSARREGRLPSRAQRRSSEQAPDSCFEWASFTTLPVNL